MQKILLIGGGSGGHILPLIPLIREIPESYDIHLLTTDTEVDRSCVADNFSGLPITHHTIPSVKCRAYPSWQNIRDIARLPSVVLKARKMLQTLKPDILFFKGGPAAFPVALALKTLTYQGKIFLHESDITPGRLYKTLAPRATKVFENFKDHPLFYHEAIIPQAKNAKPKLLIMGGSQGAQWLNTTFIRLAPKLSHYDITLITGSGKLPQTLPQNTSLTIYESLSQKDLWEALCQSDLVVSRAGASIFQILSLQKKALLIPLPGSARDHQAQNAEYFAQQNLCRTASETNLNDQSLLSLLDQLSQDKIIAERLEKVRIRSCEKQIWEELGK